MRKCTKLKGMSAKKKCCYQGTFINQNIPFQIQSQLLQLEENEAFCRSKNAQWHKIVMTPHATCMNKHLGENHTAVCCYATLLGFCMYILFINLANLYNITEKTKINSCIDTAVK